MLGANWDASRIISGFAKFGYQWKQFSDQRRENFAGLRWDIGLQWLPLSYSKVNFTTAQQTKDPDVNGDYVLESSYKVDWQHYWTSFVKTTLAFEYEKEDYSGVDRIDDRNQVLLGVDYEFSNWFTINIFAEVINSDSTQDNFIYDKQIIGGNLIFTL